MMFANKTIYFASNTDICLDSKQNIKLNSPNIILGINATQQAVLGNNLASLLTDMASMLNKHQMQLGKIATHTHIVTAPGSPTAPSVQITYVASVKQFASKIKKILSNIIKLK